MNLTAISMYLETATSGVAYKLHNDLKFKIQKAVQHSPVVTFTPEESVELANAYHHVEHRYLLACNTILTLVDENRRLQAENEFMLKLINSHMNK
jgi:hypothetical protein